jgi:hypothetical protein
MIDLRAEELLSFGDATKALPGRPHISSIYRWASRGVRGAKLESVLVGGRRYTSVEAVERFCARATAAASREPPPLRTPRERQRAIEEAEREFES